MIARFMFFLSLYKAISKDKNILRITTTLNNKKLSISRNNESSKYLLQIEGNDNWKDLGEIKADANILKSLLFILKMVKCSK